VTFSQPAPRFKFEVLSQKYDTGIPIVPEHVLSKQADVNAFQGGIDMAHTGPYSIVNWNAQQKLFDLRKDWWAIKAGLVPEPDAKRVVYRTSPNPETTAQNVVNNEVDMTLDLRNAAIKSVLEQNPKITTHTGNEPPHGYLDWWPNSLWVNHEIEPFNDVRVRKAVSLSINRDQLDEVVYEGAKVTSVVPFPLYPGLQAFVDSPEVKSLEEKYQPRKYDLDEAARLLTEAGFTKNGDGLWEKDGKTIPGTINGFESIHSDIVPIVVEQLKMGGFDAAVNFGPDAYQNMADGKPGFYMFGHGASLKDPYATFFLFTKKPVGNTAGANNFSRYNNPEFDKIVEEMGPLPAEDPKFKELAVQAMEIYWNDMINVPLIQWLHRIPYNQTYWTNFPTVANPSTGFNGAQWHTTAPMVITTLKAAG
jgi:ABC-type transport system substrate-binding protein